MTGVLELGQFKLFLYANYGKKVVRLVTSVITLLTKLLNDLKQNLEVCWFVFVAFNGTSAPTGQKEFLSILVVSKTEIILKIE